MNMGDKCSEFTLFTRNTFMMLFTGSMCQSVTFVLQLHLDKTCRNTIVKDQ